MTSDKKSLLTEDQIREKLGLVKEGDVDHAKTVLAMAAIRVNVYCYDVGNELDEDLELFDNCLDVLLNARAIKPEDKIFFEMREHAQSIRERMSAFQDVFEPYKEQMEELAPEGYFQEG